MEVNQIGMIMEQVTSSTHSNKISSKVTTKPGHCFIKHNSMEMDIPVAVVTSDQEIGQMVYCDDIQ